MLLHASANVIQVTSVSPPAVREIVDTTGAGDAFLGGLIAGVISRGIPSTEADLRYVYTMHMLGYCEAFVIQHLSNPTILSL